MNIPYDQPLLIILALATAVFGVGRLVRIATHDDFPPAVWLRAWWVDITWDKKADDVGPWSKLATCYWCLSPWLMAGCIAWGYLSSLHWSWFAFWGWLGLSYITAIVVNRDERE